MLHSGNRLLQWLMLISLSSLHQLSYSQKAASPTNLQCEYLVNPLGIDVAQPRLSWRLSDDRRGARQTAYEIGVDTSGQNLVDAIPTIWRSEKTQGDQQRVRYAGHPLQPFTKYYWYVRTWDQHGEASPWSRISSFETGMMEQKNWQGAWISDDKSPQEKAAPYFRKQFKLSKKIVSARAYLASAGLFELYINGRRIGDHRLDPMYTRFDRRLLYVTHDVTAELNAGDNAVGILLGNGWYNHQSTAVWDFHKAPWRARPCFCLDLRIVYDDGSVEIISSGKDWKVSTGSVIADNIYTGEHHDARLEQVGWNKPGFDDSKWTPPIFRSAPAPLIVSQTMQPIRNIQRIPATTMNRLSDTVYVFNLGRNISGVSQLTLKGSAGTIVRLRHAEKVYPNGRVDQSNIDVHYRPTDDQDPFQTDIFILKGEGEESFTPFFNYKGFQYVEVTSSKAIELTKESLIAYFMHSDVPSTGTVRSSNPMLDKIWAATNNSYLSNLFGYPTDCPQREKNGWTGDAHIASETGLYNFDAITIYEKWMADHRDEQQPNGVLPSIIPTGGWGYEWGNGPDWTSTIAIIPWNIYLFYGDTSLLSACYDNIRRYVNHITSISPSGLTTWGLGDWVPVKSKTPVEFTSTAYYYTDVRILANAAKLLNKKEDEIIYSQLAEKIRHAFNQKYYHPSTGQYGSGYQTELSVPLQWGLVSDSTRSRVADALARRVRADGNHIDVGLLGTKAILNALSENGHADLAYTVAAQEDFPSWGWWIKNGATTLYENWPIEAQSDLSLNHIMFGEIGAWYYKALGGIRPDAAAPGFRNILLEPHFVEGLKQFECTHLSPFGVIRSAWTRSKKGWKYEVTIPAGSTADFRLPVLKGKKLYQDGNKVDGNVPVLKLVAGSYIFEWK